MTIDDSVVQNTPGQETQKSEEKGPPEDIEGKTSGDRLAGWLIGFYLVIHIVLLSLFGLLIWIASSWAEFIKIFPLLPFSLESISSLSAQRFLTFQNVLLSACAAGLGGAAFMVREFYLNYAYGQTNDKQKINYLKNREIPRYILLPFSSIIMGPISFSLLLGGSIFLVGYTVDREVPHFTVVAVSFLLGFSYHDTLKSLRGLSRRLFDVGRQSQEIQADQMQMSQLQMQLSQLKDMHDKELITADEYDAKKKGLLEIK